MWFRKSEMRKDFSEKNNNKKPETSYTPLLTTIDWNFL